MKPVTAKTELVSDLRKTVSNRLVEIRAYFDLTQSELSTKTDVARGTIIALENFRQTISAETLWLICTALNIPADYILGIPATDSDIVLQLEQFRSQEQLFGNSIGRNPAACLVGLLHREEL